MPESTFLDSSVIFTGASGLLGWKEEKTVQLKIIYAEKALHCIQAEEVYIALGFQTDHLCTHFVQYQKYLH